MKWILSIANKILRYGLAGILLSSAMASVASANGDLIVQTIGGVSYVSGGVGTTSIDRLNSLASDFNLKLVFALENGAYVSGVNVAIADATGRSLLNARSEGPWFLTKLPAGDYQIVADLAGNAVTQHISLSTQELRTIDFRWFSE
jgi:hypothetical protein